MELGEKLKKARLEAGLSQRQLAGEEITRNMLSLIETGCAKPSLGTLTYLADRLQKPLSYFLEEESVVSPNQMVMASARQLYDAGETAQAVQALAGYQEGDVVFDREAHLLWALCHLRLAKMAIDQEREIYARELLQKADREVPYCGEAIRRERLLLLGKLGQAVAEELPSLDAELYIRAREALESGNPSRAGALLDAAQDQKTADWLLLRGDAYFAAKNPRRAAQCYHAAEAQAPKETAPRLENCYRELGDYRRAYAYACRQR